LLPLDKLGDHARNASVSFSAPPPELLGYNLVIRKGEETGGREKTSRLAGFWLALTFILKYAIIAL